MAGGDARVEEADVVEESSRYIEQYHDEEDNDADYSRYNRAKSHIPRPLRRAWHATVRWVNGPQPPRIFHVTPFFPRIQHAPLKYIDRLAPKTIHKFWALLALYASWLLSFSLVLWSSNAAGEVPGYGAPTILSCGASFWSDGNGCGLNGDACRPFTNATMAFRCPAGCASTQVLEPHAVGDQEIVYQSLTVGGPAVNQTGFEGIIESNAVYRADSFICAAAVHSGFVPNSQGGCGVITLTGQQPAFTASNANGIQSIGFDSYFPLSFGFMSGTRTTCKDLRWPAILVTAFFISVLSILTRSPTVLFWSTFVSLFLTVALASDPPYATTFYGLLSTAAGRFLPAAFCMGIMYRFFIKRSLTGLTAQLEKTVLWLGPAWIGALNNYTFENIPIQRLTPHDIAAQPGAVTALVIIILIIVCAAIGQAWAFRREGRMPRYLFLYAIMGVSLLVLLAIPGENLRIHHYILGLLLIPGTSIQNRPSLIYQGLLLGLFIDGTARWGFDSIIQTPAQLFSGSAQGSLLPTISANASGTTNITFNLGSLPIYDADLDLTYDGFSVLVNDVERFHGYRDDRGLWSAASDLQNGNYTWTWSRQEGASNISGSYPEYFAFAYLAGSSTADYTQAGKWQADGQWQQMKPGPSKHKRGLSRTVDGFLR